MSLLLHCPPSGFFGGYEKLLRVNLQAAAQYVRQRGAHKTGQGSVQAGTNKQKKGAILHGLRQRKLFYIFFTEFVTSMEGRVFYEVVSEERWIKGWSSYCVDLIRLYFTVEGRKDKEEDRMEY